MGMPQAPPVVVIILTLNQKEETLACLASFRSVRYPNFRIVLVDNASTDGTADVVAASFPAVQLVRSAVNAGVAGGRNLGLAHAAQQFPYDYALYIDNDTVVDAGFLDPLVEALEQDPRAGIAAPKLLMMGRDKVLDSAGGSQINFWTAQTNRRGYGQLDRGQYDGPEVAPCVPAGIALARRSVLEACGGFDSAFHPYGPEDLDFSLRARDAGFSFRYVPASIVYHKGNKTGFGGYTPDYALIKGRNLRRFMARHATRAQRAFFTCILPLVAVGIFIRQAARGNPRAPLQLLRGYWQG